MLRPATPLSILYLIAFVLLLLSTLSTPIIRAIPLGSFDGVDYGVFGACTRDQCTPLQVGYDPQNPFQTQTTGDFTLPDTARASLSSILIVHPVAALLSLICFALAFAAHFHGPSHSPRYLLALLILSFPTLLVTLLAFLVDILLFVPHMQWGGWIVLAATICIVASGIVTCAMRRTLVSRKARKKRIADNADMNGASYYTAREEQRAATTTVLPEHHEQEQYSRADSPPPIIDTKVPQFSTFDDGRSGHNMRDIPDTEPLNAHGPSSRSNSRSGYGPAGYGHPNDGRRPSQDDYGNPLPPGAFAASEGLPPPGLRHQDSRGSLRSEGSNRSYRSNGSRGPPPGYGGRGRGGPMGPPRGGFGSRGRGYGPGPRGGYGPGPRGGYGPGPRGGYGPPRGGYGQFRGGYGPPGGPSGPGGMRGPPPPGWTDGASMGGPQGPSMNGPGAMRSTSASPGPSMNGYHDGQPMAPPRSLSRTSNNGGPIGMAMEMDERAGTSANSPHQQPWHLRDSDSDVAGIVALQQARTASPARYTPASDSVYSSENRDSNPTSYLPPRAQWNGQPSPLSSAQGHHGRVASPHGQRGQHRRQGSENYYEDVDPHFATDEQPSQVPHTHVMSNK